MHNIQPDSYPKVEDEATIVLTYPNMQGLVQASWNWPISRKDIEIYGENGQVICRDRQLIEFRQNPNAPVRSSKLATLNPPYDDPFSYFAAVVNHEISLQPHEPSALANNLLVVEVLDAAIRSGTQGRTVILPVVQDEKK